MSEERKRLKDTFAKIPVVELTLYEYAKFYNYIKDDLYEKKEFKTTIEGFDVKETYNGILQIGCSQFRVEEIEQLLKEYKDYLK